MPSHKTIWTNAFGDASTARCPIGCGHIMERDNHGVGPAPNDRGWQRGHIIPKSPPWYGPNTIENIKPICYECNKEAGGPNVMDMRDYADQQGYRPNYDIIPRRQNVRRIDLQPHRQVQQDGCGC